MSYLRSIVGSKLRTLSVQLFAHPAAFGVVVIGVAFVAFFFWAALAPLNSAVVA